jgi:hypothetical protein
VRRGKSAADELFQLPNLGSSELVLDAVGERGRGSALYTLRTGPGYWASCESVVRKVTPSLRAWASSRRSKGSLWRGGDFPKARGTEAQLVPWVVDEGARRRRELIGLAGRPEQELGVQQELHAPVQGVSVAWTDPGTTPEDSETTSERSEMTSERSEMTSEDSEVTSELSEVTSELSEMTSERSEVTSERSEMTSEDSEVTSELSEVTSEDSEASPTSRSSAQTLAEKTLDTRRVYA